jgi:hypothetical protein
MWFLISEVELFIRPPVKKNHQKIVSKYFKNNVECEKVFGVTRFYGT